MDFTISGIKKYYRDRYTIPEKFLNKLADENLDHLWKISLGLFLAGLANLIYAITRNINNIEEKTFHFLYYGIAISTALITFIWSLILVRKFKRVSYKVKNIPVYFETIFLLVCFLMNFWPDGDIFSYYNGFVLIACVEIIAALYFNIYPNVYDILHMPFIIVAFVVELQEVGVACAMNIIIYFIIVHNLSAYRWFVTKKRLLQTEEIENINRNLNKEIEIASDIQKNFFEIDVSNIHGWEVGYYNKAMAGVSGDLFDFYKRDSILDGFGIFDVSGHGISSGLITMLIKNIIQHEFYNNQNLPLEELMEKINDEVIRQKGRVENYLTGILARLSVDSVEFVNAGHPLPIVYTQKDNIVDYFIESPDERYGVIGLEGFPVKYKSETVSFERNDEIVFYSDGIVDTENEKGEELGRERLLEIISKYTSLKASDQVRFVSEEVRIFRGRAPQKDDITLIIIKKN